jgi:acetyltransferase-like isoleucine patch superfamily enzyme
MTGILTKGIEHLRRFGFTSTAIATALHFKNRLEPRYYTQKVATTAERVGSDLTVNGPSRVTEQTKLGDNVNFNRLFIRGGGKVTIGDNFHSGPDCLILTRNHNYDNGESIPYDDTYVYKDVEIGDNVWLGARVTILPGVTIEEGAIIQAGSTVTNNISKGAIAGGHPATEFGQRDMAHYRRLKNENSFH